MFVHVVTSQEQKRRCAIAHQHPNRQHNNFPAVCLLLSNISWEPRGFWSWQSSAARSCVNFCDRMQEAVRQPAVASFCIVPSSKASPSEAQWRDEKLPDNEPDAARWILKFVSLRQSRAQAFEMLANPRNPGWPADLGGSCISCTVKSS